MNDLIDSDDYHGLITASDRDAMQYGILRKSGRYPYGSGGQQVAKFPWGHYTTQNARNREFLGYFDKIKQEAKAAGKNDARAITETCQLLGISTTDYRAARSAAKNQQKQMQIGQAQKLRAKGWSHASIAQKMFGNPKQESTVRSLLAADAKDKADTLHNIAKMLENGVIAKKFIDIGTGVEQHLGISADKLRVAVAMLKERGFMVHKVQIDQLGTSPGNKTTIKVLAPPGTKYKDVNANKSQISQLDALGQFSKDNGRTILGLKPPLSISSKRMDVRYAEQGGNLADGVMYVRPGVADLSLGTSHYAQVRVMVDGTHFLKGMAVYKSDLPAGVDIQFNTNKSDTGNKLDALKPLKTKTLDDGSVVVDHDNPFGAQIKNNGQVLDSKTGKVTSAMNIINEEGDWSTWSNTLSSQFLSKQSSTLASQQLDKAYEDRRAELDGIMHLTNPAVKKKLLESFADGTDSAAVDLKAAALPGQASHVILPIEKMKETEVYAPTFQNGSQVALVRYPHGGTFEIPVLTVNNRATEAKRAFGLHPPDAIGIHPNVAKRLSGADFDGDSVIVIPQRAGPSKIQTTDATKDPSLIALSKFDAQGQYPKYDGMKTIDGGTWSASEGTVVYGPKGPQPGGKQQQMGKVSNLITDMTIRGASNDKIARAVQHSMVVIDAEKHVLDYKRSEVENGIKALRQEFQAKPDGKPAGGASTLISAAGSRKDIRAQKPRPASEGGPIDPLTGKKMFVPKGESFIDPKTSKERFPTQRTTKLAVEPDAFKLTSGGSKENPGTRIEAVYAEHSNRMKALANLARKEAVNTTFDKADPAAALAYKGSVQSLTAKLNVAIQNRPLERQAQVYANETLAAKKADYPDMDPAQEKRIKFQALAEARARTHPDGPATKQQIEITDEEWKAIQARAISPSKLVSILDNANLDTVKKLATPRTQPLMSGARLSRAHTLLSSGRYTQAEVAQALGVSLTTLKNSIKDGG